MVIETVLSIAFFVAGGAIIVKAYEWPRTFCTART